MMIDIPFILVCQLESKNGSRHLAFRNHEKNSLKAVSNSFRWRITTSAGVDVIITNEMKLFSRDMSIKYIRTPNKNV